MPSWHAPGVLPFWIERSGKLHRAGVVVVDPDHVDGKGGQCGLDSATTATVRRSSGRAIPVRSSPTETNGDCLVEGLAVWSQSWFGVNGFPYRADVTEADV